MRIYPRYIASASPHVRPDDLATCVSCGLCLNDCPTYRVMDDEADSPRGRIQLIREMVATSARPQASTVEHLEACLVCRACETACPSLVPFGRIMEGAREEIALRSRPAGLREALRARLVDLVTRPTLLAFIARVASLYERTGIGRVAQRVLPRRLARMESLLPAPEGAPFVPIPRPEAGAQLLAGCVMRAAFGDTQRATVRALERSGFTVGSPADQECCGALHAHSGLGERARELARANVRAFAGMGTVVSTAAGCGAHTRSYGWLLADDPAVAEAAADLSRRVRDASEVVTAVGAPLPRGVRVVYQDACHLAHGQGIRKPPRDLLRMLSGVELIPIADPERCCGSAGTYNLTHPEVATELQRQKAGAILAARPDVVVSANPGCILQIRAGLEAAGADVPVVHLMRFLDDPAAVLSSQA
ncbi:MAG: 4Fe-4S dicluster domain-containing protein [Chloroflexi bacterium]|nr:4Fe-4S dicluster domain-containing protein [Chloroflexota bacterium]